MNTKDLYYFKTIADTKNITAAAKKLYIAQPSLSQFVKKLEDSVGTPLFNRTSTGLTLTYAGERFYVMAVKMLKIYENFEFEVSDINNLKSGRVTVGITRHLGSIVLPEILPRYQELCPNIEIQINELNSTVLETELLAGHLDFAIMHAPPEEARNSSLRYELLAEDPFLIALPPDSPLAAKAQPAENGEPFPVLDLKELKDESFIMIQRQQRIRQISDQLIKKSGISCRISYELSNLDTVLRCVSAGLGVTILPLAYSRLSRLDEPPLYFSIPAEYGACWHLCVTTAKEFFQTKADELFIRLVREQYRTR